MYTPNQAACFLLQGRILMTHPTKAIIGTLLKDFVKISSGRAQQGGQQVSTCALRLVVLIIRPRGMLFGLLTVWSLLCPAPSKGGNTSQHMQHTC